MSNYVVTVSLLQFTFELGLTVFDFLRRHFWCRHFLPPVLSWFEYYACRFLWPFWRRWENSMVLWWCLWDGWCHGRFYVHGLGGFWGYFLIRVAALWKVVIKWTAIPRTLTSKMSILLTRIALLTGTLVRAVIKRRAKHTTLWRILLLLLSLLSLTTVVTIVHDHIMNIMSVHLIDFCWDSKQLAYEILIVLFSPS